MDTTTRATVQAPLVPVTAAFLSGILLGTYARLPPIRFIVTGIVSAGVALWWRRRTRSGIVALLLLWVCLGALRMAAWERHPDTGLRALLSEEPQPVQLHGLVLDDPVELFEPGESHTVEGDDAAVDPARQVCVVALRHRKTAQAWQSIEGRVRATIMSPRTLVRYGDEVLVEGQWSLVPAPGNPGQYDWRASLARKRIHGLLRVRPYDGLVVLRSGHHRGARGVPNARAFGRHGQGNPTLAAIFRLRERWVRLIQRYFDPQEAGLLLALLLGERTTIDERLKDAFVETGTVHLLVVSGFNVGLIAGLLELLFRLAGFPRRLRLILCAASLAGYGCVTGWQPPVARATLMAWIVLGALALDRVVPWLNTLAAAALAIVWVNPTQLFDPGFQLSFGAVLSLLAFAGRWQAALASRCPRLAPAWLRRYLCLSVSATAAVWVGLSPVLAWYFHLVCPVSMLANVLIAPLMSALVSAGTAVLLLSTVLEGIARWSHGALSLLLRATIASVSWCHGLPGGSWYVAHPSAWLLIGYYGLLALSGLRARLRWSPARLLIVWLTGATVWAWSAAAIRAGQSRWLRVDVIDVGHGDSLLVRTPQGHAMLVDAGSQEAGRFRVLPFLRHEGVTTLDGFVLTHTDEDHLGGALPLLGAMRVRRLLTNGARGGTMTARRVRSLAAKQGIPESVVAAGMTIDAGSGVEIDVLHPPKGGVPGIRPDSNDQCLVLGLTKGTRRLLLTGDIEEAGLPWLLRSGAGLRADVLKVPHHGSRLGEVGGRFFQAARPAIAVLSVGRAHHLPAPETLEALRQAGAVVYSTREHGLISLRTDGVRLEVRTFKDTRCRFD